MGRSNSRNGNGDPRTEVLRNRELVKEAIYHDQCLLCRGDRVNTDGLCLRCFLGLSDELKKIANEESSYKKVVKLVIDKRDDRRSLREVFLKSFLDIGGRW